MFIGITNNLPMENSKNHYSNCTTLRYIKDVARIQQKDAIEDFKLKIFINNSLDRRLLSRIVNIDKILKIQKWIRNDIVPRIRKRKENALNATYAAYVASLLIEATATATHESIWLPKMVKFNSIIKLRTIHDSPIDAGREFIVDVEIHIFGYKPRIQYTNKFLRTISPEDLLKKIDLQRSKKIP
jgi:hypothetical protein